MLITRLKVQTTSQIASASLHEVTGDMTIQYRGQIIRAAALAIYHSLACILYWSLQSAKCILE